MPELSNQKLVARQVERIVRQLTSLSTLPAVAADLLGQLNNGQADPTLLTERIESDPALAAQAVRYPLPAAKKHPTPPDPPPSAGRKTH